MSPQRHIQTPAPRARRLRRAVAAVALGAGLIAATGIAAASGASAGAGLAIGRGVMPTRTSGPVTGVAALNGEMRDAGGAGSSSDSATTGPLSYDGGVGGTGIVTGTPKVYLVFWGDTSQWGTQGTTSLNGHQYVSFSNDTAGMAPVLQAFYAGLGTNGETWSGIATSYCESGATVTVRTGAIACPAGAVHVKYPSGGALAGVWADTSTAPTEASDQQIADEASAAAAHFGTAGVTTGAQFVVVSPPGAHPGGFNDPTSPETGFCAWHDFAPGANGTSSDTTTVLYTNMPYIPDAGYSCGANYVNQGTAGSLDGVTVIASHEYVETLTDPYVGYGWYNTDAGEAADICAWAPLGDNGGGNLDTSRGSFAVTGVWDNAASGCALTHAVIADHTITIANPGNQRGTIAAPVHPVVVRASDTNATPTGGISPSVAPTLTFTATGLPAGLRIDPRTGLISGTPRSSAPAHVTITVSDGLGGYGVIHFVWTVRNPITIARQTALSSRRNAQVRIRIRATDSRHHAVSFSARGLPSGLTIDSATGVITGRVSGHVGTYAVTVHASGTGGVQATLRFRWTVR